MSVNMQSGDPGAAGGGSKKTPPSSGAAPCEMQLVLIGREGVGKSCLMMQYIRHCFEENHEPTLEDMSFTQRVVDGQAWRLQIIDTAGQEEYQSLVQQYYKSGHGFLAVFDLCNKQSMLELQSLFSRVARSKDLLDSVDPIHHYVPCVIVGNKNDLPRDQFEVTTDEIQTLTAQFEFPVFETSAKTGHCVEDAFECLIRETARKVFHKNPDESTEKKKKRKWKHNGHKCFIS